MWFEPHRSFPDFLASVFLDWKNKKKHRQHILADEGSPLCRTFNFQKNSIPPLRLLQNFKLAAVKKLSLPFRSQLRTNPSATSNRNNSAVIAEC